MPKSLFDAIENGSYENDNEVKAQMYEWLDEAWQQKDKRITQMLADFESSPTSDKTLPSE